MANDTTHANIKARRWRTATPYLFIAPTFVLLAIFSYYAVISAVYYSFTDYRIGRAYHFVGFANFIRMFNDPVFWTSMKNQLIITLVSVFNAIFWPLLAAELVFWIRSARISGMVRVAFIIPMLVPGIVTTMMWKTLYNPFFGFNSILTLLGFSHLTTDWLNNRSTALFAILFIGFPYISGLNFLIFHAALNGIARDYQESASMDGASSLQIIRYMHLPNIRQYISVISILAIIGSLQNYGLVMATTGGGPGYETYILALHMYRVAFGSYEMGYGSAMGVFICLIIIVLTIIQQRLTGGTVARD